jgi:hypothetical protein
MQTALRCHIAYNIRNFFVGSLACDVHNDVYAKENEKVTSASACWGAAIDTLRDVAVVSVTTSMRRVSASPPVPFLFTILF